MRSDMMVDAEFLAGSSFGDAVKQAKTKALEWDVAYVCFKCNGVRCFIGRNADWHDALEKYRNGHKTVIEG